MPKFIISSFEIAKRNFKNTLSGCAEKGFTKSRAQSTVIRTATFCINFGVIRNAIKAFSVYNIVLTFYASHFFFEGQNAGQCLIESSQKRRMEK